MTHGSLFSGIGGFDLAAEWMGWENIFHCEWNHFGQKVLKHYWPQSILYNDITKTDFTIHAGAIDVLTGGFPCQPYSAAGKRLGKEDERHLWPEMLRAIREISPRYVVGENVRGLTNWNGGLVFDEVQADLEAAGYEVLPFLLPAAGVGAPHRRDRVWFIAYSEGRRINRINGNDKGKTGQNGKRNDEFNGSSSGPTPNPDNAGTNNGSGINIEWQKKDEGRHRQPQPEHRQDGSNGAATDTDSGATRSPGKSAGTFSERSNDNDEPEERGKQTEQHIGCNDVLRDVTNTYGVGSGKIKTYVKPGKEWKVANDAGPGCSNGAATNTQGKRMEGNGAYREQLTQIQAGKGLFGCNDTGTNWQNFPTQSPVCSGDDGLPSELDGITFSKWRKESIKAYGNAIVPQVAYQIFKTIQKMEEQ